MTKRRRPQGESGASAGLDSEFKAIEELIRGGQSHVAAERLDVIEQSLLVQDASEFRAESARLWFLRSMAFEQIGLRQESNLAFDRYQHEADALVSIALGADGEAAAEHIDASDRAMYHLRNGQSGVAYEEVRRFDEAESADPSGPHAATRLLLGVMAQAAGKSQESEAAYRSAIALATDASVTLPAHVGLAHLFVGDWKLDQADQMLAEIAALPGSHHEQSRDFVAALSLVKGDLAHHRGLADVAEVEYVAAVREAYALGQPETEAAARRGLAEVLRTRGLPRHAEAELRRARQLSRSTEDEAGIAVSRYGMDGTASEVEFSQVQEIVTSVTAGPYARAHGARIVAARLQDQGEVEQAYETLLMALHEIRGTAPYEEARFEEDAGSIAWELGRIDEAERRLARAVALFRSTKTSESASALATLGEIEAWQAKPAAALGHLEEAIEALEAERESIRSAVHRIGVEGLREGVYRRVIAGLVSITAKATLDRDASLANEAASQAFRAAAMLHGRLLFDEAQAVDLGQPWSHLDVGEQAELSQIEGRLDAAQAAYDGELRESFAGVQSGDSVEGDAHAAVRSEFAASSPAGDLLDALEARRVLLERAVLRSSQVRYAAGHAISVATIQNALDERGEALVEFVWQESLHAAFLLSPERSIQVKTFDDSEAQIIDDALGVLDAALNVIRQAFSASAPPSRSDVGLAEATILSSIQVLRAHLWSPTIQRLGSTVGTRVVLDSALARLPYAVLRETSGARRKVTIIPGPSLLLRSTVEWTTTNQPIYAIAANPDRNLAGVEIDLGVANAIPRAVAVSLESNPVDALLSESGTFNVLMISSHMIGSDRSSAAAIRLAVPGPNGLAARDVSALELMRLRLRAAVVVLLGCSSSSPSGGPEMLSIAAALLAGTKASTVIATPFLQSDVGASLLWLEIHQGLVSGLDPHGVLDSAIGHLAGLTSSNVDQYLQRIAEIFPSAVDWVRGELRNLESLHQGSTLLPITDLIGWAPVG